MKLETLYKGLCQQEVKLKLVNVRSTTQIVFGTSCYNCNTARAAHTDGSGNELCADNDWENNIYLTTMCERFISLVKPSVLVYNQYWKC